MNALVSIIVPAFNDSAGVSRCLEAIRVQRYPVNKLEVIVIDNGSTPPLSISATEGLYTRLIRCPSPGSYAARNAGVTIATGEYLAFLDADCIPHLDWISTGIKALLAVNEDVIVGGEVNLSAPPVETPVSRYQRLVGFQQDMNIQKKMFSVTANLICRRRTFDRVGAFNEALFSGGDLEWGWRAARSGVATIFEPDMIVTTMPRTSLRGAIRQARRVSAGRYQLAKLNLIAPASSKLKPHRGIAESITAIFSIDSPLAQRISILFAALIIRAASALELIRLRLGSTPERR